MGKGVNKDALEGLDSGAVPEESMHDYDPSWDFEVQERRTPADQRILEAVLRASERTGLATTLGVGRPSIFLVEMDGLGPDLSLFCEGTHAAPVIGLDLDGLRVWASARRTDIGTMAAEHFALCMTAAWREASEAEPSPELTSAAYAFAEGWATTGRVEAHLLSAAASPTSARRR